MKLYIDSISLRKAIRDKYSWPGGYEIFGIASDGGSLCCGCMRNEYHQIAWSRKHNVADGWQVIAVDCAANIDEPITCDHCNKTIS